VHKVDASGKKKKSIGRGRIIKITWKVMLILEFQQILCPFGKRGKLSFMAMGWHEEIGIRTCLARPTSK